MCHKDVYEKKLQLERDQTARIEYFVFLSEVQRQFFESIVEVLLDVLYSYPLGWSN